MLINAKTHGPIALLCHRCRATTSRPFACHHTSTSNKAKPLATSSLLNDDGVAEVALQVWQPVAAGAVATLAARGACARALAVLAKMAAHPLNMSLPLCRVGIARTLDETPRALTDETVLGFQVGAPRNELCRCHCNISCRLRCRAPEHSHAPIERGGPPDLYVRLSNL
jgi:hypothetical protein